MKFLIRTAIENLHQQTIIIRCDDDGKEWWLGQGENDPDYLAWVAAGNTAQEWQPEDAE